MNDWIGKEISHYRVVDHLGQGGMGVVYLAEDINIGRRVVLKLLKPDIASDPRVGERFLREARACAAVTHPNITTIFEVSRHESLWYICMEYVEGRTVRARLREGASLTLADAIRIAAGTADALGAAHERGIIHRDIKPENIMLTSSGQVKVLDFGLAAFTGHMQQLLDPTTEETGADRLTTQGVALGTLHYMSPEQARGRRVTPATDVFSLGSVLYEMVTGVPPFRADNTLAVMHAIAYDQPSPLSARRPESPQDLEEVVRRALRKEPEQRFESGWAMRDALLRILPRVDGGTEAPEATQTARTQPSAPRILDSGAITGPPGGLPSIHQAQTRVSGRTFGGTLVGREQEMRLLSSRLEQAVGGEGSLVLVAGEAGIGKTRLVSELARKGEEHGARYLLGRCLFREGGLPYHPFVEAADRLIAYLGLDDAASLERYIRERMPTLAGRLPILKSFLSVAGHESTSLIADKEHLLDAISALFLAFARERTLILHIDDLHWADESSLDLLLYLARNCRQSQGLIVGTYRPEEIVASSGTHPLGRLLDRMSAGDMYLEIKLGRLVEAETAAIISSAIGGATLAPEFVHLLHAETAGNPFYVLETIKLLMEDGTLRKKNETWMLAKSVEKVQIPGRVHDVVTRRLSRVTDEDRGILEVAAAEGMVFHSATIASALERSRIKVLGALQRAEKDHHLIHSEADQYTFDHPLIRETLLESIIPELRREYHRLIGSHLSSNLRGRPGEDAAIAYQYLEAGEESAALPYLLEAGDRARRLFANVEALAQLNRGETILSRMRDEARARGGGAPAAGSADLARLAIRLHKARGRLHQRLGDHDRAMSDFLAMHRAATEAGLVDRQAHALCLMSDLYYAMGEYDHAFERSQLAHDLALKAGDKRSLSHALRAMGAIHFYRAEYDQALAVHNRSIEIQKEIDDVAGYAENLNKVGNIHLFRGDREKAEMVYQAALGLGRQSGNRLAEAESLNNLGVLYYYGGDAEQALRHFEQCLEIKREIGDKRSLARSLNNLALVFEMRGDLTGAVATHQESLALIRSINDQGSIVSGLSNLASVYEKMGRYGEALAACEESLATSEAIGDRWVMPYTLNSLGKVHLWLNQLDEAEKLFDRALELTRHQRKRVEECLSLQNLGQARAARGRLDEAMSFLVQALEMARDLATKERESEILYLKGIIHVTRGEAQDAASCCQALSELAAELKLPEVEIRRLHLSGLTALLPGGAEGDAARLLEEGAAQAARAGFKEIEWRMRHDLARALGTGASSEREIVRAASIIEMLAAQTGSSEHSASYSSEPLRAAILAQAATIQPEHDNSGRKMTDV